MITAVPAWIRGEEIAPIRWDASTLTLIQAGAGYARMIRLRNRDLLCAYSLGREAWVRRSRDNGRTWLPPSQVARWDYGAVANTELLPLRDGALLCLADLRPDQGQGNTHPYSIAVSCSDNGGQTWGPLSILYSAGAEFANGCWEPAGIQLPAGEVQVYFANEGPYRTTSEQEITLLRSHDGGKTWSGPETVSFRARHRDGMPVPLLLRDGRTIAVAIEDDGVSGRFKPVLLTTTVEDNWRPGPVEGGGSRRRGALRTPLAPAVYAGAPYLRQMPSGETILSFQQSETGRLADARIVVCVGDPAARDFHGATFPFPETPGLSQLWASLLAKDAHTITVICDATINGVRGVWSIDGKI